MTGQMIVTTCDEFAISLPRQWLLRKTGPGLQNDFGTSDINDTEFVCYHFVTGVGNDMQSVYDNTVIIRAIKDCFQKFWKIRLGKVAQQNQLRPKPAPDCSGSFSSSCWNKFVMKIL